MSVSISSNTQYIINNKEYRCPKCSLIPFINIFTNENKLFMSTNCHIIIIFLNLLMKC